MNFCSLVIGSVMETGQAVLSSQTLVPRDQSHDIHPHSYGSHDQSHDQTNQSAIGNLSTIEEDSLEISELGALADAAHSREVELVRSGGVGGVGRSASDETLMRERQVNGKLMY